MKIYKIIFLISANCLMGIYLGAYGQSGESRIGEGITSVLPVSPEAASLSKYIESPIDQYTGIPDIGIPIFQTKRGDINIEVALKYHSGGNKVDEIASREGLGWTMLAGGVITRASRGLPDQSMFHLGLNQFLSDQDYVSRRNYLLGVYRGQIDSEPDLYYFNLPGLNCKAFKGASGEWVVMPRDINIKIVENAMGFDWIITNGTGVRYKFKDREFTSSMSLSSTTTGDFNAISSWYLTEIEDSKGNIVNFYYDSPVLNFITKASEKVLVPPSTMGGPCIKQTEQHYVSNQVSAKRIKKVEFKNGSVEFEYSSQERSDLQGDSRLSDIEIRDASGVKKKFSLHHSYFQNNLTGKNSPTIFTGYDAYRLRLDSLVETNGSSTGPAHSFLYNNTFGLPYRNSHAKDRWGFFNGKNNQLTSVSYMEGGILKGADKTIDPSRAQETLLSQIKYPTGGTSNFIYEGNVYYSGSQNISGPGLRIKNINHKPSATKEEIIHYSYLDPSNGFSSGIIGNLPDFGSGLTVSYGEGFTATQTCEYTVYEDASNYPLLNTRGSYIGYTYVTTTKELNGTLGKSIFKYNIVYDINAETYFPFPPSSPQDWKRGLLLEESHYRYKNGLQELINRKVNEYSVFSGSNYEYYGVKVAAHHVMNFSASDDVIYTGVTHVTYPLRSDAYLLTTQTNIDKEGVNERITVTDYTYSQSNFKISKTVTDNSDNTQFVFERYYPGDYQESSSSSTLLSNLLKRNMVDVAIEEIQYTNRTGVLSLISASCLLYESRVHPEVGQSYFYLKQLMKGKSDSFSFSTKYNFLSVPAHYKESVRVDQFNLYSKPLTTTENNSMATAYLYGYEEQLLVAEGKNMVYGQLSYTSFETADKGGWNYAGMPVANYKTGKSGYNLSSGSISKTGIAASSSEPYRVGFWARTVSGTGSVNVGGQTEPLTTSWKWVEKTITSSSLTISGSNIIVDELRLHPADALMTSYTYEPLVGMTTQTDSRGYVVYYEYDTTGRLMTVKDEDGHILEHYEYNYASGN